MFGSTGKSVLIQIYVQMTISFFQMLTRVKNEIKQVAGNFIAVIF